MTEYVLAMILCSPILQEPCGVVGLARYRTKEECIAWRAEWRTALKVASVDGEGLCVKVERPRGEHRAPEAKPRRTPDEMTQRERIDLLFTGQFPPDVEIPE